MGCQGGRLGGWEEGIGGNLKYWWQEVGVVGGIGVGTLYVQKLTINNFVYCDILIIIIYNKMYSKAREEKNIYLVNCA